LDRLCQHVPFVVVLTVQLDFAYFFWLAYGTMAFLLGPLRTWSVLLGVVLWHQATTRHQVQDVLYRSMVVGKLSRE